MKFQFDVGLGFADMKISRMSFDGAILKRGYWIYVILIYHKSDKMYLYIGRTGDEAKKNAAAASPFQRIGEHLNYRQSAKANTVKKCFDSNKFPEYQVRLIAVGPLFPKQNDPDSHVRYRDKMKALEKSVAEHFISKGYYVPGKHYDSNAKDLDLAKKIIKVLEAEIWKEERQLKIQC
ncbi:MAG: hypothetical protein JW715_03730 [Sedimentisphaerales bacterium]|nr:hypothetical protein [Sedimentisphaerales bacterium]